jgi:hypothetical protein
MSSSFATPSLPSFGTPTYTPIPDLSDQSMYNIVFSCYDIQTNPPPTTFTPDQLQKRQATAALCQKNNAYFCKYIQDTSASVSSGDYMGLTNYYCQSPPPSFASKATAAASTFLGVGYVLIALGALLCASLSANQLLYMPMIMRIFVFLVVFAITFVNPFAMVVMILYYVFLVAIDVYRMSKGVFGKNLFLLPATLLPLRLRRPADSLFMRVLLGMFTYVEPNPADDGHVSYLEGADQYVNRLQEAAHLTEKALTAANMKGMKDALVKELKADVIQIGQEFEALQAASSSSSQQQ